MPIYEYQCEKCGLVFEKIRSISKKDEPLECPECKMSGSKRKISLFSSKSGNTGGVGSVAPRFT